MQDEMLEREDSLSLAMYEYAMYTGSDIMEQMNRVGKEKWRELIMYGQNRGEFGSVDIDELITVIIYSYQGVRMWSRIVDISESECKMITDNIRKQLVKEKR